MINDPIWVSVKDHMFNFLAHFVDLINDHPGEWHHLRNVSANILCLMESGSVSWSDRRELRRLRNRFTNNAYFTNFDRNASLDRSSANTRETTFIPCPPYQRGQCEREGSHSGYTHMCSYCWATKRKIYRHPEQLCYANSANTGAYSSKKKPQH